MPACLSSLTINTANASFEKKFKTPAPAPYALRNAVCTFPITIRLYLNTLPQQMAKI